MLPDPSKCSLHRNIISRLECDVGGRTNGSFTYLCPHQLHETANELRCSIDTQFDRLLVHDLADVEPQGSFEALRITSGSAGWVVQQESPRELPHDVA
jgi:hypothetical protein